MNCEAYPSDCAEPVTHKPCCDSHGRAMCCNHYCYTHFVQVNGCRTEDHR